MLANVPDATVPQQQVNPAEDRMPVAQPEYELIKTLALLEERKKRLEFD